MAYDTTLKDLLARGSPALLQQLSGAAVARFEPIELPSARDRRPDLLARLTDGRLLHVELQSQADPRMAWRMLEYYTLIAGRFGHEPVHQIVVALTDAAASMTQAIDHPHLRFDFSLTRIGDLDAGPLLASASPNDNVLAILCRADDIRQRVGDILARLGRLPENDRRDSLARLLILAGLRRVAPVVIEEVKRMPVQIDIRENEYLMQLFTEGKAEGKAEVLLRLLERRFASVPEGRRAQIQAATPEQLDPWLDAVLEADSLDAVFDASPH